jgi:pantoate--beta-alanine ligase
MQLFHSFHALRQSPFYAGPSLALIPTMGALHEGHLTLVREALKSSEQVIVSIFVNPAQFGPNEDFAAYPRDHERDQALLEQAGAHALYLPSVQDMYPEPSQTQIRVGGSLTQGLCAPFRPGHFEGVALVVAKLFNQLQPSHACFGEKDWQQLQVIRRMVQDLDMPVRIQGVPTIREEDGLALSSRNAYLSAPERNIAAALPRILQQTAKEASRITDFATLTRKASEKLLSEGFTSIDYVEICDEKTLEKSISTHKRNRVLAAARLGRTRLIDNWPVDPV